MRSNRFTQPLWLPYDKAILTVFQRAEVSSTTFHDMGAA